MSNGVNVIGEINFHDIKIKVYYNDTFNQEVVNAVWQMRNPDTCYQGLMYMNNETGKISYPEGAVIPEQNDRDREMLPKYVIVGIRDLTKENILAITSHLDSQYIRRNNINNK